MPTPVVPLTVAPLAGAVNAAVTAAGGGGVGVPPVLPFLSVTLTLVLPVLPVASFTYAVSVIGPSGSFVVSHVYVSWVFDTVSVVSSVLPAHSWNWLAVPCCFSTHAFTK